MTAVLVNYSCADERDAATSANASLIRSQAILKRAPNPRRDETSLEVRKIDIRLKFIVALRPTNPRVVQTGHSGIRTKDNEL
jgi:hypothetical protein